ncbi:MAG: hypothetical protein M3Z25_08430 [Actinomycetota bacterium]|nr:hypothetical protein [Actinomycetota bacterium]
MTTPNRHLRAYLDDGPRNGETVSIDPNDDGSPPERIVLNDDATLGSVGEPEHTSATANTTYGLSHTDMDNGLWVYRAHTGGRVS